MSAGYSDLLSLFNAPAAERSQMIADLFNSTPNPNIYTEFRLTHVSRSSRMHQHVHDLTQSQVDGTSLTFDIASKTDTADTAPLHTALDALRTRQQENKTALEKASAEIAELQEVFAVLVGAEKKMKGWSNINLVNIQDAAKELHDNASRLRDMTDALPSRDGMLVTVETSLQKLEKSIGLRVQREDLATYLKAGIATNTSVGAPKTARFTRRQKVSQP
ncbi:MAG: hypothetical protein PSY14_00170 [bacterium]|nr:hypothetical protein [bacterium]